MQRVRTKLNVVVSETHIPCILSFNPTDPFAVTFEMERSQGAVTWVASRECLEQALSGQPTEKRGDIAFESVGPTVVMTIKPPNAPKPVPITLPGVAVWLFLAVVNRICPREVVERTTSEELDWLACELG